MARPKKEINKTEFEKLCAMQCTEVEICGWLGVTDKTLSRWCKREYGKGFSETFKDKRAMGKISLRRYQFQLAEKSPAMAIWLGKQFLDQRDVQYTQPSVEEKRDPLSAAMDLLDAGDKSVIAEPDDSASNKAGDENA